ncbi:MAG TPA: sigma factor, partial [Gemmata sp.]|nr:sigma factor [Gemmata sp.]
MGRRFQGLLERLLGSRQREAAAEVATDSELLRRFAKGDQEAFELLIWRHGAMVLGTCQRLTRDEHLAEDAFQAVFLVLARQGRTIRSDNVVGWLYRVSRRIAAQAIQSRLQTRE